jgi:hypothetical protein
MKKKRHITFLEPQLARSLNFDDIRHKNGQN